MCVEYLEVKNHKALCNIINNTKLLFLMYIFTHFYKQRQVLYLHCFLPQKKRTRKFINHHIKFELVMLLPMLN